MTQPYSTVDASGRYLASITPKQGRSEVQFYPISQNANTLIDESKVARHELQVDLAITAVTWLNENGGASTNGSKNGKKRSATPESESGSKSAANAGTNTETRLSASLLLAVALALGEVWVFAPQTDMPVAQIEAPEPVISMAPSSVPNRVWALVELGSIYEINVIDGEPTKTIRFGKMYPDVRVLGQCKYETKKRRNCAETEVFFAASSRIVMVDGARSRGFVAAEFCAPLDPPQAVTHLQTASADGRLVAVARELPKQTQTEPQTPTKHKSKNKNKNSNTNTTHDHAVVEIYDAADPSLQPVRLPCLGSEIRSVRSLNGAYVVAHTPQGADVFVIGEGIAPGSNQAVATVTTSVPGLVFENLYWTPAHGVVGVWYDGCAPRFVRVSPELVLEGAYNVPVEYANGVESSAGARDEKALKGVLDITFTAGEKENSDVDANVEANMPPSKLFSELSTQLVAEPVDSTSVLTLCRSVLDEDIVKDTIRQFAYLENYATLVEKLFEVVGTQVARDPSQKSALSVWLRWVLLAHGGHLAKQTRFAATLRTLQRSLDDGMRLMPKLLALQGRLQLLKAQAELRNAVANGEFGPSAQDAELDAQQRELDALNETTFNNTTHLEESVVYANGENDDFEDAVDTQPGDSDVEADADADADVDVEAEAEVSYANGEAE